MAPTDDRASVYHDIGVKPIINAFGTNTRYGGSKLRPEAMEAMNKAATVMVEIDELNKAAGKVIAKITGAEAGFVSSGAAGGLLLQAAAVIAGSDPAKMARLPDATGLKNEIIIHHSHRFPYDQSYRAAGAQLVDIGDGRRCAPWQLEAAFTDRTAAVAYLVSPYISRRALPLEQVCEIAHAHDVPVIVDAASVLPPRSNLRRFHAEGADMVIHSGGKQIRGPQSSGVLSGRADLIEAAAANASPNQFVGRGMKVPKEEIIGLITALEIFANEDEEAEMKRYREMSQTVVDALIEVPGLRVTVEHDDFDHLIPAARIKFTLDWNGPSREQVMDTLAQGDPPIFLSSIGDPDELTFDPFNIDDEELEIVVRRVREALI